tara:strand:- start:1082 stop:1297 length:216 start_codon:yes stop_codon:yes gene_type:complete
MIKYYKVNMNDLTNQCIKTDLAPECFKTDLSQSPLVIQWESGLRHDANMEYINRMDKTEITEDEWILIKVK